MPNTAPIIYYTVQDSFAFEGTIRCEYRVHPFSAYDLPYESRHYLGYLESDTVYRVEQRRTEEHDDGTRVVRDWREQCVLPSLQKVAANAPRTAVILDKEIKKLREDHEAVMLAHRLAERKASEDRRAKYEAKRAAKAADDAAQACFRRMAHGSERNAAVADKWNRMARYLSMLDDQVRDSLRSDETLLQLKSEAERATRVPSKAKAMRAVFKYLAKTYEIKL